ncbi:helix-turn-helix domain-containing protein [Asticcacaulis excentricus]|uniref:Helix-turn-helix domain protein n=1 Tax=Asticcacaulis excentricus (strain ATCC 15261 / DSM 4724 / KCTC 12464 / NCIMB 9791 / VKM B-1370 / CB 48) TaxID=573065 RepID=E8RNG5_ASTEC|nr:helix-turn-helix transcriptional regulator [Asticcacaulis excentricus]ADU11796.1 helix-turn-helix domain protein [Asticcacaulis excentricus CB 48]
MYLSIIMKKTNLPSIRAQNELKKLGADIAAARKRRSITQARLAEGAGINVSTVRRLESGDHGISLGVLAMVLVVLGEPSRLGGLLDGAKDEVGLMLDTQNLPQRVRLATKKAAKPDVPSATASCDDNGEAF